MANAGQISEVGGGVQIGASAHPGPRSSGGWRMLTSPGSRSGRADGRVDVSRHYNRGNVIPVCFWYLPALSR